MSRPGAPHRMSMLGNQSDSKLPSAPMYGFGTEERPQPSSDKGGRISPGPVYYPKPKSGGARTAPSHSFGVSHRYSVDAQKHTGSPVPGPGQYQNATAIGRQRDSQKHSYSTWKFGTSTRKDQAKVYLSNEHQKSVPESICSPGPCSYDHVGSVGLQCDSRKPTNTSSKLGTSDRFFYDKKDPRKSTVPGPGTYVLQNAVGAQVSSMKPSYPVNSFPRADRERTAEAEYLGKKLLSGRSRASPGPAVYSLADSVGNQVSSVKRNVPHYGFGTADRFAYQALVGKASQTPGPGTYST